MKSLFLKSLVAGVVFSPVAYSLSLYDIAPPIGLPESHAVRYSANVYAGYDDNLNSSKSDKQDGAYAGFGVSASYADYESVTKLNYHANVGGQIYNKNANGIDRRIFSNISGGVSLQRSLDPGTTVSVNATLCYRPEPDYSNGISAARTQGDCLNWSLSTAYSSAIDSRWSWTLSASTSGNIYSEGPYQVDNRKYLSASASLHYKQTMQTSYSASLSHRFDFREHGEDSRNFYGTLSVNHAIDPVSSCNLTLGVQLKNIAGRNDIYPHLRGGYTRKLDSHLSVNSYVSLDNENVDTYGRHRGFSYDYLSDMTWRVGSDFRYAIDQRTSVTFGASLLSTQYSHGTNNVQSVDRITWSLKCGANYSVDEHTTLNLNYTYTHSTGTGQYGYDRNVVSAGLTYTF